ncbi:hypothetical protein GCM10010451_12150 [Streptomyces virens]|uniref:Carboxylesterase type B domain-containing protein n=1 Tax=Streptomyces virens TaxID=285572 RepID=A0ABP6P2H2_9ACTN|nr:hypothetical protein [Streptomyces calvus]
MNHGKTVRPSANRGEADQAGAVRADGTLGGYADSTLGGYFPDAPTGFPSGRMAYQVPPTP